MSRPRPQSPAAPPRLRVEYVEAASPEALLAQSDVLAVFGFHVYATGRIFRSAEFCPRRIGVDGALG